ncbi:MAG: ISNCY family transposase [Patescibacteria group bacterium]
MEKFTVTARELERQEILKHVLEGKMTARDASIQLHLSVRQVVRLKRKLEAEGVRGLVHGNRGKMSNRRVGADEAELIMALVQEKYVDFTPTFAAEKLSEEHNVTRDPRTVRRIMIDADIWQKKKLKSRVKQIHRTWRKRRDHYGELIQFDGSYEYWLEDRNQTGRMCLLAAIDDATGKITYARFADHEGVFPVFSFWSDYLKLHGKPVSIYLDKFSTYNQNQVRNDQPNDTLTQFERACLELRIALIKANSPQAKGRVERLFHTLQDRLVKELRLAGIATIEEANRFLHEVFISNFSKRFSVFPMKTANLHRLLSRSELQQLPSIFSRHVERIVNNDFTISFNNTYYQLTKDGQPVTICKKDTVTVEEWTDHTIHLKLRGKELTYRLLPARPMKQKNSPWVIPKTSPSSNGYDHPKARKPAPNHPWRSYPQPLKNG